MPEPFWLANESSTQQYSSAAGEQCVCLLEIAHHFPLEKKGATLADWQRSKGVLRNQQLISVFAI